MASNADVRRGEQRPLDSSGSEHPIHCVAIPEFRPAAFLRCRHRQTLGGVYLPSVKFPYTAECRLFSLPDGDQLALHDDCPADWRPGDRVALMIHGLVGCHQSPYLMRISGKLLQRGVRVFRLDLRGTGSSAAVSQLIGHAGRSEDAVAAVEHIHELCPLSSLSMVGFSMGGNIVLKALGEAARGQVELPQVERAVAIAPPIQLAACCDNLANGFNRVYDRSFAKSLIRLATTREQLHPQAERVSLTPRPRGVREFDRRVTAPLSGFEDEKHYYEVSSSAPLLADVVIPTLILAAADDPLIPAAIFDESSMSSAIRLHIASHGGHLGFVGRRELNADRRWMDWRVVEAILC